MIRPFWAGSVHTSYFLRRYLPTNILLDLIRTRGLQWGIPATLLAVPCLLAASIRTDLIAGSGPGWLNLVVLRLVRNAMKFLISGPVCLVLLCPSTMRRVGCPGSAVIGRLPATTRRNTIWKDEGMNGL